MGFVLIRHSALELRRVNMDRVPVVCWRDCRKDKWGRWERAYAVGQCLVRQGMGHDTCVTTVLGHKDVQIPEPSSSWATTRVRVMKCCQYVQYALWHTVRICTCCLSGCTVHTLRRLTGGFSPGNRNWSQLWEKPSVDRAGRMLRIPTARLPIGLVPRWWRWRSCLARDPDEVVCRFLRDSLWNLQPFELLFFSLSNLLTATDGSVVLLSLCQVVCILFSLEQCQVVDWVVTEVFCLAWEGNASIFEFSLLLLRRRHDSPVQFDRIALCGGVFSTRFLTTSLCTIRWRTITKISLGGFRALSDVPFWASVSLCSTFFVFQKVRIWHHVCCSSW